MSWLQSLSDVAVAELVDEEIVLLLLLLLLQQGLNEEETRSVEQEIHLYSYCKERTYSL